MLGPVTVGKKAAKAGYRRYGVKGAVAGGIVGAGGYVVAKRVLASAVTSGGTDGPDRGDESTSSAEGAGGDSADADGS